VPGPESRVLTVRAEQPGDHAAVDAVVAACFARPGQDPPEEVPLVQGIRALPDFDPALSLVADLDGAIIGHLLFSNMTVEDEGRSVPALALAPLAVLKGYESSHAGTALMRAGLEACRERGHRAVIVLGHPKYYRRFGFRPARQLGIEPPEPWNDAAFQALALVPGGLDGVRGVARYAPPFGIG
jgi:putative acetyltransferase